MGSIVKQKVGKHIYLYESVSYRDQNGQPRNSRTIIGKIEPSTGEPIYKMEYIERMAQNGTPLQVGNPVSTFTLEQIRQSSLKEYGAFYLFQSIAEKSGLLPILRNVFTENWEKIFTLICYLVSSGEPVMYFDDWLNKTESVFVGSMSSQRISELLASISTDERLEFFKQWGAYRCEQEYLALDITSVSSYSELIRDVE